MPADAPTHYLASGWGQVVKRALLADSPTAVARADAPSILVSYAYSLSFFLKHRARVQCRSWMLDSGAYTAWTLGTPVDLDRYIDTCRELQVTDPALDQVVALDVIGDWRQGGRNVERMWAAGVPALPVWHIGEPEDLLVGLGRDYPKICIGGTARLRGFEAKRRFAEQAFARVWPKAIHGLAVGADDIALALPWHSTDASNWTMNPARFGRWKCHGGRDLGLRSAQIDLREEIRWYLGIEAKARHRWRREMEMLDGVNAMLDSAADGLLHGAGG